VHSLTILSVTNALYTFLRKRHYRLFEAPIEDTPSTPSVQRVKVASSPSSASPMRLLSSILSSSSEDRSHPVPGQDVWQLGVWDPHPLAMKLFCFFSPGHVLIYWLFLPTLSSDPRPSVTLMTTILLAALLTVQMSMFVSSFSRQSKDMTLVHKEVLHEYDTKYVHPRTRPLMRSVATQFYGPALEQYNHVETYTPTHKIQGYRLSPRPSYGSASSPLPRSPRPSLSTPSGLPQTQPQADGMTTPNYVDSSPLMPRSALQQPQFVQSPNTGDGGSLGVYSHAKSPLRRATSTQFDQRGYRDPDALDRVPSPTKRGGSPLKRSSVPGDVTFRADPASQRYPKMANIGRGLRDPAKRETGRFY
jgi:hypothetical protein